MDRNKPLANKRVVVTRAREQAGELTAALERLGAEVLLLPTVEFAAPENFERVDAALRRASEFDAILFVSANAVRYILARCRDLGIESSALASVRLVAAVGAATKAAAKSGGVRVDYVAKNQTGEALAEELRGTLHGRKILLPRSDLGNDRLAASLREAGAEVTEIVAYRTAAPKQLDAEILKQLRNGEAEAIVFASPSAFRNLSEAVPAAELAKISERVRFAAIGPTTARALREAGVRVEIEANESSSAAMADAIAKYYERQLTP